MRGERAAGCARMRAHARVQGRLRIPDRARDAEGLALRAQSVRVAGLVRADRFAPVHAAKLWKLPTGIVVRPLAPVSAMSLLPSHTRVHGK